MLPALLLLAPSVARGAETQWWITDSAAELAKSEARGLIVHADGAIGLGPEARMAAADSLSVVWAIAVLADGSVAMAGDGGRIDRWTESAGVRPWVKLPVGQVLSLGYANGELLAGTAPQGLVYRIGTRGDTALFARTGERYVWGLAPAGAGAWYAATGTRGRLMKLTKGASTIVVDSDESNLVCALADGKGGVYAGGDSRGRVVHVRADGSVRTVFDAPEDEVRALALGPDGALYVASLSASAVSSGGDPDDDRSDGPSPVKSASSAGRGIVYRVVPDSMSMAWWTSPQPFVFALLGRKDGVLAATGNRAALYALERAKGASQWLAAPQGQITALAGAANGTVYAATSNPCALWRVGPGTATKGELLSGVSDAKRMARFGRMRWHGQAKGSNVELYARSGNTDTPDTTWSPWRGGATDEAGRVAGAPPARYLQWKLALAGGAPRIESVEVAWREFNLPPRVDDLVIAPQGAGFREGELVPRSESVTQSLPGGQKVEYTIPSASTPKQLRELPMWARGLRTVQWRGSDPNGDALRYRVDVRAEGGGTWMNIGDDLEASAFTWDTRSMPDGRYRLRVTASDAAGNAVGEEDSTQVLSEPFPIDNTPPTLQEFRADPGPGSIVIRGRAEDAENPLSRIEVSLDDQDWRVVNPEGGMADDRSLSFRATLPVDRTGEHTVSLRVVDLTGNSAQRATRVTVTRLR